jgi:hypothetical protein
MGFKILGLNIDIPFKSSLEGVGKGIKHLCRGEFRDAVKATLKGMANDITGQIALACIPGFGQAMLVGSLALGLADGFGFLDTKEEKLKKQQESMREQRGNEAAEFRGQPHQPSPQFGSQMAAYAGQNVPPQFAQAPFYPQFASYNQQVPPLQPPQFSVNWGM